MSIHKAHKNLANQKRIQISLQPEAYQNKLLGAVTQTDYTGGVLDCLRRRLFLVSIKCKDEIVIEKVSYQEPRMYKGTKNWHIYRNIVGRPLGDDVEYMW